MSGQHRGRHRDPVGAALQAVWALGHIAVIGLPGITAEHQLAGRLAVAASAPDTEPATPQSAAPSTDLHL